MRIARIEPFIIHVPLQGGIRDSTNSIDHWGFTGVILHADNGLQGYGFTATHACLPADQQIAAWIDRIYGPLLSGEILEGRHSIQRLWKKLHDTPPLQWVGRAGVSHLALAAVDIALWDLFAKRKKRPPWQVLCEGRRNPRLEAYDTSAGWLSIPLERLVSA